MTFLLIVGVLALAFGIAFGLTDRYDDQPDDFEQSTHVHVLDDQEPAA